MLTKQEFFEKMENMGLALSYNDVTLRTGQSKVLPSEVNLGSWFSRRIPLNIPIVSSPMDTVTLSKMAIAVAEFGGLGIIHKNLTPEEQAAEAARVKFHLNGMITRPITVMETDTAEAILNRREKKGWEFHSFLVTNTAGKLVGILTGKDFLLCTNPGLSARDIMTRNVITAPIGTDMKTAFDIMCHHKIVKLPLVDESGGIAGMFVGIDVKRNLNGNPAGCNLDANGQLRVGATIGTGDKELERAKALVAEHVDVLVIDTAHGDSNPAYEILKQLKKAYPHIDIVAGNVSEGPSAKRLVDAGADGIRVGQGPGSTCTTRVVAGVGCPQLTAVYECAKAIEGSGVPICADGGIEYSGHVPKAIGALGHNVMLGGALAGTDESPGEVIWIHGWPYKKLRGMGSLGAMQEREASRLRYGQVETGKDQLVPEGVEGVVPLKGPVNKLLHQFAEGLRRGMSYVGAANIEEMRQKANFRFITSSGKAESHPHDIEHIQDAPNYQPRKG